MFTDEEIRSQKRGLIALAPFALALLVAVVLVFAAFAKLYEPDPKDILMDRLIGVGELIVVLAVLIGHSWRVTWLCVSMMFAGFSGWAAYAAMNDVSCGCFGTLWTPPVWVSLSMDIFFVVTGVIMGWARGATRDMILVTLVAVVLGAAAGYFAYDRKQTSLELEKTKSSLKETQGEVNQLYDQLNQIGEASDANGTKAPVVDQTKAAFDNSPIGRVMKLDVNADIRAMGPNDPAWVIFIHDRDCHVCEEYKYSYDPMMEDLEARQDPVMRIRMFEINELEEQYGIEYWNWDNSPNVYVVHAGRLVEGMHWQGEENPYPEQLQEMIEEQVF